MITSQLNIKWIVNPRLKSSIRYKTRLFSMEIELPKSLESIGTKQKHTILEYIDLKKKRKRIPRQLKSQFSSLFPQTKRTRRNLSSGEDARTLIKIIGELNKKYFNNTCVIDDIFWSKTPSKRTLGRYYAETKSICISSYLNNKTVPCYVLEYIVYHEMCHQMYPPYIHNGRRAIHHKGFKTGEKKFAEYAAAILWIKSYIK